MSVNAVRNPYAGAIQQRPIPQQPGTSAGGAAGAAGARTAAVPQQKAPATLTPLARPAAAPAAERALPSETPAHVDPELWSVLTQDERAFFAKAGQMGPLTYGRAGAPGAAPAAQAPVAMRGGRLDIRA